MKKIKICIKTLSQMCTFERKIYPKIFNFFLEYTIPSDDL